MPAVVRIPSAWRKLTSNRDSIEVDPGTVESALGSIDASCPGFREKVFDSDGSVVRFVNIYVNKEDIRFKSGLATEVHHGDEINIIPAIAGG
jgi:molybdopterin converting factor small subunit